MEASDPIEDATQIVITKGRLTRRTVPWQELRTEIGHQDRQCRAVPGRAKIGRDQRAWERQRHRCDESLAKGVIARRARDPVDRPGGPLEDEPAAVVGPAEAAELCARPPVAREWLLGDASQAVRIEELGERPVVPVPQHGAGKSVAPSGPPSR